MSVFQPDPHQLQSLTELQSEAIGHLKVELEDGSFHYTKATLLPGRKSSVITTANSFILQSSGNICPKAWFVKGKEQTEILDITFSDRAEYKSSLAIGFLNESLRDQSSKFTISKHGVNKGASITVSVSIENDFKHGITGTFSDIERINNDCLTIECPEINTSDIPEGSPVFFSEDGSLVGVCAGGALHYLTRKMRNWIAIKGSTGEYTNFLKL